MSRLIKRSFSLAGHRTSVALEPEFWAALTRIAGQRGHTLSSLVSAADAAREPQQPLASSLRVLALHAFDPDARAQPGAAPPLPPPHHGAVPQHSENDGE